MPRKPRNTILCITADRLVRADFDRAADPAGFAITIRPRPAIDDLPGLVETTIRLGSDLGKRVWVLSSDIFLQIADLTSAPGALDDDELRRALAFELEPLSNISGLESLVGYAPLASETGHAAFLVSQISHSEAERINEVVRRAGGQLAGIAHPAGAPAPLHSAGALEAWARVEVWADATVRIERTPGQPVTRSPLLTPLGGHTHSADTQWGGDDGAAPADLLLTSNGNQIAGYDPQLIRRLDTEDDFRALLSTWARILHDDLAPTQVIHPPKRPAPAGAWTGLAAAVALVAIGGCAAHWWYVNQQITTLQAEVDERSGPATERDRLQTEFRALASRVENKRNQLVRLESDIESAQSGIASFAARPGDVLHAVWLASADLGGQLTLTRIEADRAGLRLIGDVLSPRIAAEFADSISAQLSDVGLRVDPPRTEAEGRLWTFEIPLRDRVQVPNPASALAQPAPARARGGGR